MSNIKKRVLVIVSALALALIMGAVSDGPEYDRETSQDSASVYDLEWQVAEHDDAHGGG